MAEGSGAESSGAQSVAVAAPAAESPAAEAPAGESAAAAAPAVARTAAACAGAESSEAAPRRVVRGNARAHALPVDTAQTVAVHRLADTRAVARAHRNAGHLGVVAVSVGLLVRVRRHRRRCATVAAVAESPGPADTDSESTAGGHNSCPARSACHWRRARKPSRPDLTGTGRSTAAYHPGRPHHLIDHSECPHQKTRPAQVRPPLTRDEQLRPVVVPPVRAPTSS